MRRIRVLHITPSVRLLGARRSLLTLVKELKGTRVEPLVIVPSRGALTDEFDRLRINYRVLYLPPWRKGASWLKMGPALRDLKSIIHEFKADLVHCNEIYPAPHALCATTGSSARVESLSRILNGRQYGTPQIPVVTHMRLSVNPRLIKNYYLGDATRLIAVSNAAAGDFDAYPWKTGKVQTVYNGIEFEPFLAASSRRDRIRSELGYSPENFVIGQFGLMMPRKRPKFLLDAVPLILEKNPNARFLFIGDSSPGQDAYLESLKKQAQECNLGEAVQFLPFQSEIADYFAALDLNMLVSNDEGFGRVILEAAAAGVPTVGSRVGGIPELIQPEETGFLIGQAGSSETDFFAEVPVFANLVERVSRDRQELRKMAARARERALKKFSTDKYVKGVVSVFEEALDEFDAARDQW